MSKIQQHLADVLKENNDTIGEPQKSCEFCDGYGKIENMLTTCDDSTGFNQLVEGTGTFKNCFNCNQNDIS